MMINVFNSITRNLYKCKKTRLNKSHYKLFVQSLQNLQYMFYNNIEPCVWNCLDITRTQKGLNLGIAALAILKYLHFLCEIALQCLPGVQYVKIQ